MDVERFDDVAAFEGEVADFLMANEAAHNLPLSILSQLQDEDSPYADAQALLAVVRDARGDPVLVAMRTPPWSLLLSLARDPAAVDALVDHLVAARSDVPADDVLDLPGANGPVDLAESFADRWTAATGGTWRQHMAMRVFETTSARHPDGVPGSMRWPTDAHRETLREWSHAFQLEALGEELEEDRVERALDRMLDPNDRRGAVVWEVDGEVVSMAAYGGPTPHGIRVFAVYTPPERRRNGYATACTAALTQHLLDGGRRFCFLYTDLANPTSNAIYQWIGYRPVLDASELRFDAPAG